MTGKFQALVGCQNDACAAEVSHHLDMLRLWKDGPVCEDCYDNYLGSDDQSWSELPRITLGDLCE